MSAKAEAHNLQAIENPYLDEIAKIIPMEDFYNSNNFLYRSSRVAEGGSPIIDIIEARQTLVRKYSYAVPTPDAIYFIAQYSPLIEVGAGRGYWAWLLRQVGADIKAFDIKPPRNQRPQTCNGYFQEDGTFIPVQRYSEKIVSKYPDRTLFLCWPPYSSEMAFNAVSLYQGSTLIYIGEGDGGCTGDDKFHSLLEAEWTETDEQWIPQWFGIHDSIKVYQRNNE